jgi:predicted NBD/HSP70 family sugar kinase
MGDISTPRAAAPTPGDCLALIRSGRATTRSELGRATGLSRTAVTARVNALARAGLLVEAAETATGGRPAGTLRLAEHAGVVLAAAVGRSRTQLAACTLGGTLLATADLDQEVGEHTDQLMPRVGDRLADLLHETGHGTDRVRGAGVSIPGTVDTAAGASLDSPVMARWAGVPLAPYLDRFAAPVFVDNDANVMALSERAHVGGQLARFSDVLLIKASTGIGAGVVLDGALRRGGLGAAGELGHTKVTAAAERPCRCGETGCLEAVAGGWALVQVMREHGHPVGHVRDVVALASSGDPAARQLVRESGRHVGEVVAAAVNLLNPQAVVVGGDMAAAFDTFVAGLRESVYAQATALASRDLQVVAATHGERTGVVGCAALALDHVLGVAAVDALVAAG